MYNVYTHIFMITQLYLLQFYEYLHHMRYKHSERTKIVCKLVCVLKNFITYLGFELCKNY